MHNTRRKFLKDTSLVSLGFLGLHLFAETGCNRLFEADFGSLSHREGDILSLPRGFSAKVISRAGDKMSDGLYSPGSHDGMGLFPWGKDKVMLIRNHELMPGSLSQGPYGKNLELLEKVEKEKIYDLSRSSDKICMGGTTTFIYNEKSGKIELEYLSLAGTVRNCSGGVTPWKSWITCEESPLRMGDPDYLLEKEHGYNFEVPATDKIGLTDPVPIKAMGRFVHESIAVHPETGIVYQTEDESNGLIYRYLPDKTPRKVGDLHKGGRLQCLALADWESADTRNRAELNTARFPKNKPFDVFWIDLEEAKSPDNELRIIGHAKGAALFASGEGMSYGNGELFFTASYGGQIGAGQIFKYTPSIYEGQPREKEHPGKLELFLESNDPEVFRYCDNVTIAPWGDIIICEDVADARIIGITPKGKAYVIAKNIGYRESEFTGPVFSTSGNTLFVNIQNPGLTLAITGPWKS
ncbi:MAG: DUF839 domain-containing protein [Cyclobacteriaceae bacterium]|nr:DUF839 domain-containing protein [Cyclobacteriaceae bacterium]